MIVKKLRIKNKWSQEQLAEFSGLNVRTIQRVESGSKASIETLKCLASVFEIEIDKLTGEITVIDKSSEDWKALPWWFRVNMLGVGSKKALLVIEFGLLIFTIVASVAMQSTFVAAVGFLSAYMTGWLVRYGDTNKIW